MTPAQYSLFAELASGARLSGHGEYDEMVSGDGRIRPHWRALVGALQSLPEGILSERVERIYRQYQDTALAYSVESDRQSAEIRRPFDIIPMVLAEGEWAALEAGLAQRARLFDRLLADLYGPRRVLSEGLVPAGLIHCNPRFLRPCAGIRSRTAISHLHVYAADLIRAPDGGWRVLTDRLQSPGGIGFALQNRSILARTLPELFRARSVRRIEPFFELWRDSLAALAPRSDWPARIVVLTPGPFNAAYFEHVYLARQLDAILVEGADLTFRDGRVHVKTLGHLQPVDVILRFIEDDYCDPLELRGNSVLGVAGLLQAVRAGTVVVANALGSSVVETPALRGFLPRLAETLLGESLILPSVETEWLGMPDSLERLGVHLPELDIKPVFATRREEQAFAAQYQKLGRRALLDEVQRRPGGYVAERRVDRSVMPVWTAGGMIPRPVALRMFLVACDGHYRAMPGGLAQVPYLPSRGIAPIESVLASKDSWVLAGEGAGDGQDNVLTYRPPTPSLAISQAGDELRSRSADDLFWLGRYAERLDNAARTMRSALARTVSEQIGPGQQQELHLLTRILSDSGLVDPRVAEWLPDSTALRRAIAQATSQDKKLQDVFRATQRIARSLRDRLSSDMWQVVIGLVGEAREKLRGESRDVDTLIAGLDHLVGVIAAFGGMASENMTRGIGWRFLDLGRRIERGVYGTSVLRNALARRGPELEIALAVALELFDSSITYRSRYLSSIQPVAVLALVLGDDANPRALRYQLRAIAEHLQVLVVTADRSSRQAEKMLLRVASQLLHRVTLRVSDHEMNDAALRALTDLLEHARERLLLLSDVITRTYFSQVQMPHSVGYEGAAE